MRLDFQISANNITYQAGDSLLITFGLPFKYIESIEKLELEELDEYIHMMIDCYLFIHTYMHKLTYISGSSKKQGYFHRFAREHPNNLKPNDSICHLDRCTLN